MQLLPLLALLAAAAPPAQERQQEGGNIMGPYVGQTRTAGPTNICGHGFALQLASGEAVRRQEGPDFFLYYVDAADGPFLLYEGNFPQPHDDEISTGEPFPAIIAIHDNRTAEAKARSRIRDRVLTGEAFHAACPAGSAR